MHSHIEAERLPGNEKAASEGGSLRNQEDDNPIIAHLAGSVNGNRYHVDYLPIDQIKPSPENDGIYGKIDRNDEAFNALQRSIDERGLEEPLILTADGYILSGHRRFEACKRTMFKIPCRIKHDIRREGNPDYLKDLIAYNPQRVKSVGSLLREAILRDSKTLEDTQAAIRRINATHKPTSEPDYMEVAGYKEVGEIGPTRQQFLTAVQRIVEDLRPYWPLNIRQIHYQLLNDPPLKKVASRSKFDPETNRYRNDPESYEALSRLCAQARYQGLIPWSAIDDSTRTFDHRNGFTSVTEFIEGEINNFLLGYHRDKQHSQPIHIEVLIEKNTLVNIVQPVCREYYVPMTSGRGFAGPSVWHKMSERFDDSEKERMALLIISDYDPEGFELAYDAIRSLRDLWGVPIEGHRVAVTEDQITERGLQNDFNPAKQSSTRYQNFVDRTGGESTWECEALPPEFLRDSLRSAIESNMNMEIFRGEQAQQVRDTHEIHRVRQEIASGWQDMEGMD